VDLIANLRRMRDVIVYQWHTRQRQKIRTRIGDGMVEIRLATEGDLYRIAQMTRDLTRHLGAFVWRVESHLRHVKRRFANRRYIYLVAVEDEEVVGFTGAELKSSRTAYLMKGYVEPSHRRRGVMRQLEGALIEILREKGVSKVDLIVDTRNQEGRATWIALGYETTRETMRKQILVK
jgi:ribosomal protein S18 acetylase RimI-like enzyme